MDAFYTQIDFFTAKWGPAGAFGGPNPVVGCRAFGALPVNSVRVYGGSRGFTEPGCELADFGGPFASFVEANNWKHFVYGTAEEAFAVEEVRVQVCLYHGFPVRQVQWVTNPGPNARPVMPFAGNTSVDGWAGIVIWLKEPVTRAKLLVAPYGVGAIAIAQLLPPPVTHVW